ncbi:MAG: hypothetical protein BWX47_00279 [candidate division Hyd24-12 bacterium ADurb.Bin004]|nr:MAG: hypothetical protein BWX47_00279 [candidate division Hyd24-12 bacterium ADurb.Bin004]
MKTLAAEPCPILAKPPSIEETERLPGAFPRGWVTLTMESFPTGKEPSERASSSPQEQISSSSGSNSPDSPDSIASRTAEPIPATVSRIVFIASAIVDAPVVLPCSGLDFMPRRFCPPFSSAARSRSAPSTSIVPSESILSISLFSSIIPASPDDRNLHPHTGCCQNDNSTFYFVNITYLFDVVCFPCSGERGFRRRDTALPACPGSRPWRGWTRTPARPSRGLVAGWWDCPPVCV